MDKKSDLINLMSTQQGAVKKLLDDVTDEESTYRLYEQANHIRWLAGHLVYNAGLVLKYLGSEGECPADWEIMFSRGSVTGEKSPAYPSIMEIRNQLYSMYKKQLQLLDKMTTEDFTKNLDTIDESGDSPLRSIQFLCSHEFYHLGQIMMIRRMLGRDRSFG